jgi:N-acyl-D-amino-acid deacylase
MNKTYSRRKFLRTTGTGALAAGTGILHCFNRACTPEGPYDLLIRGGTVYDGLGNPGIEADVAIRGERIVGIGKRLNANKAGRILDAQGLAVSPGFIDMHTHTGVHLIANPLAESHIRQGITTEISGNCGSSPFPIVDSRITEVKENLEEQYQLELTWRDMEGFFQRLEEKGIALNYATFVGHGVIRGKVVGYEDQSATPDQISEMQRLIEAHMHAGAWGLSTGLEYTPSSFADTAEIIQLCHKVAELGGIHSTHMRNEDNNVLEAIDETIQIARETGVSTQISHLKMALPANWHKIDEALARIEEADKEGIRILADRYPYIAAATGLSTFFPEWARAGSTEDFIQRLKDPSLDLQFRSHLKKAEEEIGSWKNVRISAVVTERNKAYEGMDINAGADMAGKQPYEFMRDIIIEEKNQVGMVKFVMNEDNLKRILAHPLLTVGSDGNAVATYGVLGTGKPHPRYYGTFPRFLGKYVREEKILTWPQAIQKITSLTAQKLGFQDRGQISPGYYADLVLFDPKTIIDRATFDDPHQYPDGIQTVIVNGAVGLHLGESTGELSGKILKKRNQVL